MNENKNLIYDIHDKPKTIKEWILYPIQMLMSVFVATVLIASICGTPIDVCLLGGCLGTLTYQICTKFRSPMFISNSGATVSAVIGALALGTTPNYLAVAIGGCIIAVIYGLFAILVKYKGIAVFNKIFPATIVGPVTVVIGLNLAGFIKSYVGLNNFDATIHNPIDPQWWVPVLVAIVVAIVVAVVSKYAKGFWKTIPFLFGLVVGYIICLVIELCTPMSFGILTELGKVEGLFRVPEFAFLKWNNNHVGWSEFLDILLLFTPVSICALLEHYSDHKVLGNIIGHDLTEDPGLHKTLMGDGVASMLGTWVCGLPNTSYGESVATIGFSKVASVIVTTIAALVLGCLAFIDPFQALLKSIPSCVFGGCAIILYGYIACSGLKTIFNNKVDLENNKNLIVVSSILTVGVSGLFLFSSSFAGVSLAMVVGVILNLLLGIKKHKGEN